MASSSVYTVLLWVVFAVSLPIAGLLLFVSAPYGRHLRSGWGPTVPAKLGWLVMELPSVFAFAVFFFAGRHALTWAPLVLFGVWQLHYVHRTLIYPFRMRSSGKRMPLSVVAMALMFTLVNGYVNGHWVGELGSYPTSWLWDPRMLAGCVLFVVGFVTNVRADSRLFRLRAPGEQGYKLPRGGLHELVSCPNYFGEILEWCGWALATWSLAGLSFAVFTLANLVPRALTHHRWYQEEFEDFPSSRKAIFPFLL